MPRNVTFHTRGDVAIVQGAHDGYHRLLPRVTHRRTFASVGDSLWIVVDDLLGSGSTTAASHIHLAEEIGIASTTPIAKEQGVYSPTFGELRQVHVIVLRCQGELPLRMAYALAVDRDVKITLQGDAVVATTGERSICVTVPSMGLPSIS